MLPFNFAVHKTSESFIGNSSTRTFIFTQIPVITKTDIQLSIYDSTTLAETIIDYEDFTLTTNSSSVGFTIALGINIITPTNNQTLIAKLIRVVKNDVVFPDGSSPTPQEMTIGFQALCLSMATLLLNQESSVSFPIADVLKNLEIPLIFPQIDTNSIKSLLALRKNDNNKYEFYYENSIDNIYNVDVKEINNNYVLTQFDNIILFKANSPTGKKITLYRHLNIADNYTRHIEVRNESSNSLSIEYNGNIIDTAPALTTCFYKINSSADYSIV